MAEAQAGGHLHGLFAQQQAPAPAQTQAQAQAQALSVWTRMADLHHTLSNPGACAVGQYPLAHPHAVQP